MPNSGLTFSSGYHDLEEALFENMTSFKDQCDQIAAMPVTNEAERRLARAALGKLISGMQMFSTNFTEGHQRGSTPGYPGLSFGTHVEGSKAATA